MADPRFARRAAPPTNKTIWHERLQDWSGGIALVAFILVVVTGLGTWRMWGVRDAADAPLQRANAIVTGKSIRDWQGKSGANGDIKVQLNGMYVIANTTNLQLFDRVQIGDIVAVAYRVGRSGTIYIAELGPQPVQHAVRTDSGRRP